jgi:hypothetical protein
MRRRAQTLHHLCCERAQQSEPKAERRDFLTGFACAMSLSDRAPESAHCTYHGPAPSGERIRREPLPWSSSGRRRSVCSLPSPEIQHDSPLPLLEPSERSQFTSRPDAERSRHAALGEPLSSAAIAFRKSCLGARAGLVRAARFRHLASPCSCTTAALGVDRRCIDLPVGRRSAPPRLGGACRARRRGAGSERHRARAGESGLHSSPGDVSATRATRARWDHRRPARGREAYAFALDDARGYPASPGAGSDLE